MNLPQFDNPPVVEVALGIQFETIRELRAPVFAEYWEQIRAAFPRWTEAAALAPGVERFGVPPVAGRRFKIEFHDEPPPSRALFESAAGDRLIQVQADRFVTNWRKGGDPYPRYESAIRPDFRVAFDGFRDFLHQRGHECQPNQWEVTYVNFIHGERWDPRAELGRVLTSCASDGRGGQFGSPEWAEYGVHFVIEQDSNPVGRLHVNAQPGVDDGEDPVLRLSLTARGYPSGPSTDHVLEGLDLGREYVVRGFAALTTPEMHRIWGKR